MDEGYIREFSVLVSDLLSPTQIPNATKQGCFPPIGFIETSSSTPKAPFDIIDINRSFQ